MTRFRYLLWPAGLVFGVAAEWIGRPQLIIADAAAGYALVFLGLAAWSLRPESRAGPIMGAAGFAWFLGTAWNPAVFLHRGLLAHLVLSYPSGRISSRLERSAVGAAYAYAAVYPVADNNYATIAFALGLVALSIRRYSAAWGTERRARLAPLAASAAFGVVLVSDAATRLAGSGGGRAELWAYDLSVFLIAVGLFADLLWGRWTQAAVTGLVIDLGEPGTAGTLRDRLARTLGDPALVLAYRIPGEDRYVDGEGRTIELPLPGAERVVTPIDEGDRQVAALIHDAAVLGDPQLVSAVTSATRLAVSNVRLQADVRERVTEVEASRRRIVEAGDAQRRRLERELRDGAEQRLARVMDLLADSGKPFAEVREGVPAARAELRELARGIRPQALTDHGLRAAVEELAERSMVPVDVVAPSERFPPAVEATAYFVCSEALANAAKYADASRATVAINTNGDWLLVEVADDGVGGAGPMRGSGLSGLADRIEALGGRFRVDSPRAGGTRIHAELPFVRT